MADPNMMPSEGSDQAAGLEAGGDTEGTGASQKYSPQSLKQVIDYAEEQGNEKFEAFEEKAGEDEKSVDESIADANLGDTGTQIDQNYDAKLDDLEEGAKGAYTNLKEKLGGISTDEGK